MDPIGLLGGLNTNTYVVDLLVLVDPLGLMCGKTTPVYRVKTDVVASQRIFIDESGNITIPDRERMFFETLVVKKDLLNFVVWVINKLKLSRLNKHSWTNYGKRL